MADDPCIEQGMRGSNLFTLPTEPLTEQFGFNSYGNFYQLHKEAKASSVLRHKLFSNTHLGHYHIFEFVSVSRMMLSDLSLLQRKADKNTFQTASCVN